MSTAGDMYDGDDIDRSRDLARLYGCEFVDLNGFHISRELLQKVPVELMFRYNFVPLEETMDGRLAIAVAVPSQLMMIEELKLLLRRGVVTRVSPSRQIDAVLKRTEQGR